MRGCERSQCKQIPSSSLMEFLKKSMLCTNSQELNGHGGGAPRSSSLLAPGATGEVLGTRLPVGKNKNFPLQRSSVHGKGGSTSQRSQRTQTYIRLKAGNTSLLAGRYSKSNLLLVFA